MKIRINLQIFLFIICFILTKQINIYITFMIFVFLHEMGHMIAGILLGFKISFFEIMPFGTSIGLNENINDYNKKIKKGSIVLIKRIIIFLVGPIVNLVFLFIFNNITFDFLEINSQMIVYCNLLIFIFNLIPIYPLDGGRILKDVIHILFGMKKSYKYTYIISNAILIIITIISSILILFIKNIALFFIIIYLWCLVLRQNKIFEKKQKILDMF